MIKYFKIKRQLKYYDRILNFVRKKPIGYKTSYKDLFEHLTNRPYPSNLEKHTETYSWLSFKKNWFSKKLSITSNSYEDNEKLKNALDYIEEQGYIKREGQILSIKSEGLNKSFWSDYKSKVKFWTKLRVWVLFLIVILTFLGFNAKDIISFITHCFLKIISILN